MEGIIEVSYTVMCQSDVNKQIPVKELLANEKVMRAIKSEFAKGLRNILITAGEEDRISITTEKEVYEFIVNKDDFADILVMAEEDARKHKRIKKECEGIELVNIETMESEKNG